MQIHSVVEGDRARLTLDRGPANRPEADSLCDSITRLVGKGVADVVVDLQRAAWIGAAGIGALVCGLKAAQSVGARVRLTGLSRSVRRALEVSAVAGLFPAGTAPALPEGAVCCASTQTPS